MSESPPSKQGQRIAIGLALLYWIVLPSAVWCGWGTSHLEKWLTLNVMPIGFFWNALLFLALFLLWRGQRGWSFLAFLTAMILWLVGNPTLGQHFMSHRESQYETNSPSHFSKRFDAIVMLGGCASRLPDGRPEVSGEGQRVVSTAEFWHADKTDWIITTGGEEAAGSTYSALIGADLLAGLGVPRDRIILLPALNTFEEIREVKKLITEQPAKFPNQRIGLVTSAFHMPRAMRLAVQAEIELIPLPSGHRATLQPWKPTNLIPSAETINNNSSLFKEYLARLVGR